VERIIFERDAWGAPDVARDAPGGVLNLNT
jgi:hypothetical protein